MRLLLPFLLHAPLVGCLAPADGAPRPDDLVHAEAVNRTTVSGRVAAPEQRCSRLGALAAVTLEAAYSLRLEHEVGSIEPGKLANFTVLDGNPVTCDAARIQDLSVWGTVVEGRVQPVPRGSAER